MKNLQDLARRITVRPADPADSVEAAQLIFITGEAMFKYAFYSDINKTIDLIGNLFQMEGNDLTYKCTYIAEIDGQVGGMIHFADKQCWANNKREMGPKILGQMGTLQTLARIPRFFHLQQLVRKIDESAIYIKHLATREAFRRRGLAKRLLAFCEQHATEKGLSQLALDVEVAKQQTVEFYQRLGFSIQQKTESRRIDKKFGFEGLFRMIKEI